MPKDPECRYWDACCFTSYLNGVPAERMPNLDGVYQEVRDSKGSLFILSSTLSFVEVAFTIEEQKRRRLRPEEEKRIDDMLTDTSTVRLVEPHELIMKLARVFIRKAMLTKRSLKAADAIHLATAKHMGAAEFKTYDGKLLQPEYATITGLVIRQPVAAQPSLGLPAPGT